MTQIVPPDFSVTGRLGLCLEYASRLVFHNPTPGTTAWQAWLQTQFKLDVLPSDGFVPHWFSGAGGAGHVVIGNSLAGYHSSPYSLSSSAQYQQGTTTHALLPSIAEVERIYGVKYVGASLDILGLKVAEENDMTDRVTVNRLLLAYFTPDDVALAGEAYVQGLVGRDTNSVVQILSESPQFAAKRLASEDAIEYQKTHPDVAQATILGKGTYVV